MTHISLQLDARLCSVHNFLFCFVGHILPFKSCRLSYRFACLVKINLNKGQSKKNTTISCRVDGFGLKILSVQKWFSQWFARGRL